MSKTYSMPCHKCLKERTDTLETVSINENLMVFSCYIYNKSLTRCFFNPQTDVINEETIKFNIKRTP
jgi:hypothetical protein